jgi:hypothetical protein
MLIIHDWDLVQACYAGWQWLWSVLGEETLCQRFVVYVPAATKQSGP